MADDVLVFVGLLLVVVYVGTVNVCVLSAWRQKGEKHNAKKVTKGSRSSLGGIRYLRFDFLKEGTVLDRRWVGTAFVKRIHILRCCV